MPSEKTLIRRCLDHIVPEPLQLIRDDAGDMHFATESQPLRTIINTGNLPFGDWLKLNSYAKTVTVTCDGKTVVYKRVARDIHGHWICDKVSAP